MDIKLTLPLLEERLPYRPELRPAKVKTWLAALALDHPGETVCTVADALAALNRVRVANSTRLELLEGYHEIGEKLWRMLRLELAKEPQPLSRPAIKLARHTTLLMSELALGYKRVLAQQAARRLQWGESQLRLGLIHRTQQSLARVLLASFSSYCPVPANTWCDLHQVYAYARSLGVQRSPVSPNHPQLTPEISYVQTLLLALANPYGFAPGQLALAINFIAEHCGLVHLGADPPKDVDASSVATIRLDGDDPPVLGRKIHPYPIAHVLYLANTALLSEIHRQLRESGAAAKEAQQHALLSHLKRQWHYSPRQELSRVPKGAAVTVCSGLAKLWQLLGSGPAMSEAQQAQRDAAQSACTVVDHAASNVHVLRQARAATTVPIRIGDIVVWRRVDVVQGQWYVCVVRWLRNTMHHGTLDFGCETLGRQPEAAAVSLCENDRSQPSPVLVLGAEPELEQHATLIVAPYRLQQGERVVLQNQTDKTPIRLSRVREENASFTQFEFLPA